MLGIGQFKPHSVLDPFEFAFCDMNTGAWRCPESTTKTPFGEHLAGSSDKALVDPRDGAVKAKKRGPINKKKPEGVVFFGFDQSELRPEVEKKLLEMVNKLQGKMIALHGYTDNIGVELYNEHLAKRRASNVKDFLDQAGLPAEDLYAVGHGLCCYLVPNGTEAQRDKNRRVEIYTVKNKGFPFLNGD